MDLVEGFGNPLLWTAGFRLRDIHQFAAFNESGSGAGVEWKGQEVDVIEILL